MVLLLMVKVQLQVHLYSQVQVQKYLLLPASLFLPVQHCQVAPPPPRLALQQ
jgi:hypothetical protein